MSCLDIISNSQNSYKNKISNKNTHVLFTQISFLILVSLLFISVYVLALYISGLFLLSHSEKVMSSGPEVLQHVS